MVEKICGKVSFEPGMEQWMCDGGWEWWAGGRWIRECDSISRVFYARLTGDSGSVHCPDQDLTIENSCFIHLSPNHYHLSGNIITPSQPGTLRHSDYMYRVLTPLAFVVIFYLLSLRYSSPRCDWSLQVRTIHTYIERSGPWPAEPFPLQCRALFQSVPPTPVLYSNMNTTVPYNCWYFDTF